MLRILVTFLLLALLGACTAAETFRNTMNGTQPFQNEPAGSFCGHREALTIERPAANVSAHLAAWSGVHKGWWSDGVCTSLVVKAVRADGSIEFLLVRASTFRGLGFGPSIFHGTGRIQGGQLKVDMPVNLATASYVFHQPVGTQMLLRQHWPAADQITLIRQPSLVAQK